jgi:hypothetical protein
MANTSSSLLASSKRRAQLSSASVPAVLTRWRSLGQSAEAMLELQEQPLPALFEALFEALQQALFHALFAAFLAKSFSGRDHRDLLCAISERAVEEVVQSLGGNIGDIEEYSAPMTTSSVPPGSANTRWNRSTTRYSSAAMLALVRALAMSHRASVASAFMPRPRSCSSLSRATSKRKNSLP